MEADHVVDIHVSVVVRTKRDHFSKYDPKRSNHANFQLLKIKNKKVMNKKPLIFENTNPPYGLYKSEHYFVEAFYSSNSDLPLQKTKQYF